MEFNNLTELAKAVSVDILRDVFLSKRKFPVDQELNLDIHKLPDDDGGDMDREDPEEFIRLVNNCITIKLNYLYDEGFLAKKKGFYRMYSQKELQIQLEDISTNGID